MGMSSDDNYKVFKFGEYRSDTYIFLPPEASLWRIRFLSFGWWSSRAVRWRLSGFLTLSSARWGRLVRSATRYRWTGSTEDWGWRRIFKVYFHPFCSTCRSFCWFLRGVGKNWGNWRNLNKQWHTYEAIDDVVLIHEFFRDVFFDFNDSVHEISDNLVLFGWLFFNNTRENRSSTWLSSFYHDFSWSWTKQLRYLVDWHEASKDQRYNRVSA